MDVKVVSAILDKVVGKVLWRGVLESASLGGQRGLPV